MAIKSARGQLILVPDSYTVEVHTPNAVTCYENHVLDIDPAIGRDFATSAPKVVIAKQYDLPVKNNIRVKRRSACS